MSNKNITKVLALIVLVMGLFYIFGSDLNSTVRVVIEKYGSAASQTTVKLGRVKISLSSGTAELSDFSVGNPEGFRTDQAVIIDNIDVVLDKNSIKGDGPIILNEVNIKAPQITYEVNGNDAVNLQFILRNIRAFATLTNGDNSKTDDANKLSQQSRRVIIDRLTVSDGQISVISSPSAEPFMVSLPPIHLNNIGRIDDGASFAEVAATVLGEMVTSAAKVADAGVARKIQDSSNGQGSNAANNLKENVGGQSNSPAGK